METRSTSSYLELKQQLEQTYASPVRPVQPPEAAKPGKNSANAIPASKQGHVLFLGIVLLMTYFATNLATIQEIYCGGMQVANGKVESFPTPIASLPVSAQVLAYVTLTSLGVFCAVMLTRLEWPQSAGILNLIPILVIWRLLGVLLRKTGPAAKGLSCVAVLGGTVLTGLASMYFVDSPIPLPTYSNDPLLHSLKLQAGLGVLFSGIFNLLLMDSQGAVQIPSATKSAATA